MKSLLSMFLITLIISSSLQGESPVLNKVSDQSVDQQQISEAQIRRGFRAFFKCRSCHTLDECGDHLAGPNLYGFMDKAATTNTNFDYSSALKRANLTWDDETLRDWLKNPTALVNGTKMALVGLTDESEIAALIYYLRQETSK